MSTSWKTINALVGLIVITPIVILCLGTGLAGPSSASPTPDQISIIAGTGVFGAPT